MWAEAKDLPRRHQDALGSVVWAQMHKALDDKADTAVPGWTAGDRRLHTFPAEAAAENAG